MEPINHQLEKVEQEKQSVLAQEAALKQQRRYQIGLLAEECGLLAIPDQKLCEAFQKIAHNNS